MHIPLRGLLTILAGMVLLLFMGYQLLRPMWGMVETTGTVIDVKQLVGGDNNPSQRIQVAFQTEQGEAVTISPTSPEQFTADLEAVPYVEGDTVIVHYFPWQVEETAQIGPVPKGMVTLIGLQVALIVALLLAGGGLIGLGYRMLRKDMARPESFRFRY